jgi:hypothetical protein
MPGLDDDHARLDGQAIRHDRALRALAVGAEDALRGAVLGVMAERADAVGEQGGRDGLSLACLERLPLPRERDRRRLGRREYRMFLDAMIDHVDDSSHDEREWWEQLRCLREPAVGRPL